MAGETNLILRAAREGRILVYGHRGARFYAPMNTLPSFLTAIGQGADGIELDVQLTADRELVVIHDFTVDGTTDGTGAVRDLLFAELRDFDAAAKFRPQEKTLAEEAGGPSPGPFRGVAIPTLEEVFALVRDAAGPDFVVNVEIKAPYCDSAGAEAPVGAEAPAGADGIEAVVADCIRRYGMEQRVVVSSFNPPTLARFKAACPEVPVGFLVEENVPVDTPALMAAVPHEAWHPRFSMADEASVSAQRRAGRSVNVWTVNDGTEALRLARIGASGIITDVPDRILAVLGR